MARPQKKEQRRRWMECNNCGHQFEGLAWYVSIRSAEGTTFWNLDDYPSRGNRCPQCRSVAVRVLDN